MNKHTCISTPNIKFDYVPDTLKPYDEKSL